MRRTAFRLVNAIARPFDAAGSRLLSRRLESVRVTAPILIIGAERSGTTLLYSVLANHPSLYWLSRLDSVVPDAPAIACGVRRLAAAGPWRAPYAAVPGAISRSRGFIPPSECLPYWRRLFKWGDEDDYRIADDEMDENDLTPEVRNEVIRDMEKRLTLLGKRRLLLKQPGFSLKIRYFDALFPGAVFVHVLRDPFANAASLVRAKASSGESFWGTKVPGWRDCVHLDAATQAAVQLKCVLETIDRDRETLDMADRRYIRVRFEDLLTDPEATVGALLRFCDLAPSPKVERAYVGISRARTGHSDRSNLPAAACTILEELSVKYGYA